MGLTVICEECGKKYLLPTERLDKIPGEVIQTKCRHCGHVLTINKPKAPAPDEGFEIIETDPSDTAPHGDETPPAGTSGGVSPAGPAPTSPPSEKRKGLGLRANMIILFLVVPLILMSFAAFYSQRQLNRLAEYTASESDRVLRQQAEACLQRITRSVAAQCRLFIAGHPQLSADALAADPGFKSIAVQNFAAEAMTYLYEIPEKGGIWRVRAHKDDTLVGKDLKALLEPTLGSDFSDFWQVFTGPLSGQGANGYVKWRANDGRLRRQFLVCVPVAGTRFAVAGVVFEDALTHDIDAFHHNALRLSLSARNMSYTILSATVVVVFLVVILFSRRLVNRIAHLTEVAERISVGDLDAEITITSNDEIGRLADAVSRMQDSLRRSIDRLRKRKMS